MKLLKYLRGEIRDIKRSVNNDSCANHSSVENYLWLERVGDEISTYRIFPRKMANGVDRTYGRPISFRFEMIKEGLSWKLYDNLHYWLGRELFDCALTRKNAETKLYERAKRVGELVSRRIGIPFKEDL